MCRGKDHAGRRCPGDTSEARRLRRKAQTLRTQNNLTPPQRNSVTPSRYTPDQFQAVAQQLRDEIYAPPAPGLTQEEHDAVVEEKITAFGRVLAEHAEAEVGIDKDEIENLVRLKETELYPPDYRDRHDSVYNTYNEAVDEYNEARRSSGDTRTGFSALFRVTADTSEMDEEVLTVFNKAVTAHEAYQEHQQYMQDNDAAFEQYHRDLLEEAKGKLAVAYRGTIAGLRPVGGEMTFSADSDEATADLLRRTVGTCYPSDWLDRHHREGGDELVLKSANDLMAEAEYRRSLSPDEEDGVNKTLPYLFTATLPAGADPEKLNHLTSVIDGLTTFEASSFNGPVSFLVQSGPEEEAYEADDHGELVDGRPAGEHWEFRPTISSLTTQAASSLDFDNIDTVLDTLSAPIWVRPNYSQKKMVKSLTVYSEEVAQEHNASRNYDNSKLRESVAIHEFGHRIEDVNPALPRLELAFLKRRSNAAPNSNQENITYDSFRGLFHRDVGMVDTYMSREYFRESYEVFTTGIESLYSGGYGSLNGLSKVHQKSDADHKAFTLGVLATL